MSLVSKNTQVSAPIKVGTAERNVLKICLDMSSVEFATGEKVAGAAYFSI